MILYIIAVMLIIYVIYALWRTDKMIDDFCNELRKEKT